MAETNPWASFEAKRQERKSLPPLELGGETYVFPTSPPAILWFEISDYQREHKRPMPDEVAATKVIPVLIGEDRFEKLCKELTLEEMGVFVVSLFEAWGWSTEEETPPNRQARRASRKTSGKGSARSKQTSSRTTASSSKSSG